MMSKPRSRSTLCGANVRHGITFVISIAAIFAVNPTWAAWPERPITIIVPFPAGGGTDVVIRSLQPLLSKELGQTIVVENRGGAGGTIGSAQVARSKADGYTALLAT
ncbi:MAG: Bug family tripartite tricarboxylate transporter substrate binding protein, partial [Sphingobacterium sp.]